VNGSFEKKTSSVFFQVFGLSLQYNIGVVKPDEGFDDDA